MKLTKTTLIILGGALVGSFACEPCEVDADCRENGRGLRCLEDEDGNRFCGDCSIDEHCRRGSICDVGLNECYAGCRTYDGCRTGLLCDLEREVCVQCLADADCPLFSHCANAQCVQCSTNEHCGERQICAEQQCVDVECSTDDHCPGTQTCDLGSHECACVDDSECVGSTVECYQGRCVGPRGACYHRICKEWDTIIIRVCVDLHTVCRDGTPSTECRWNWSPSTCHDLGIRDRCEHDPDAWCRD